MTLTCPHGTIALGGTQECNHQTSVVDLCDAFQCTFSLGGILDSPWTFAGWTVGGQSSVSCASCLTGGTLYVYTPNPGDRYSASLTLEVKMYSVTGHTFENGTTTWLPAEVQVCLNSACTTAVNGDVLKLAQNAMYTITASDLQQATRFSMWTSNAGSLSDNVTSSTDFTAASNGTLTLIMQVNPVSWIGYADSNCAPSCTSASGIFTLPSTAGSAGFGVWVGIGGLGSGGRNFGNLWQAGVQFNESGTGSSDLSAWWEDCSPISCSSNNLHYNYSFKIDPGDLVLIWVKSGGGSSWFEIQDLSEHGHPGWSYTDPSFTADTQYAEWVAEPLDRSGGTISPILAQDLELGGLSTTMYDGYLGLADDVSHWYVTPLETGVGYSSPQFWIGES